MGGINGFKITRERFVDVLSCYDVLTIESKKKFFDYVIVETLAM